MRGDSNISGSLITAMLVVAMHTPTGLNSWSRGVTARTVKGSSEIFVFLIFLNTSVPSHTRCPPSASIPPTAAHPSFRTRPREALLPQPHTVYPPSVHPLFLLRQPPTTAPPSAHDLGERPVCGYQPINDLPWVGTVNNIGVKGTMSGVT
jgi:hypothetical protein